MQGVTFLARRVNAPCRRTTLGRNHGRHEVWDILDNILEITTEIRRRGTLVGN